MKTLALNLEIFRLMWIIPTAKTERKLIKFRNITFSLWNTFIVFMFLIHSIHFFMKTASTNLESALYAVIQIFAFVIAVYLMGVGHAIWPQLLQLFTELQRIYDASGDESFTYEIMLIYCFVIYHP